MEAAWLEIARTCFDKGFAQVGYASTTALVVIIRDNKLFVANAGDSKAVLLRQKPEDGTLE